MKWNKRFIGLAMILTLVSCAKDDGPSGDLNGGYYGTYEKNDGVTDSAGTVRIVFVGANFSGESQGSVRPICNGTYNVIGDSIDFKNLCSSPDADLLLVGKYKLKETGDSLYFSRTNELFSLKQQ